jgi:hypothetical protein
MQEYLYEKRDIGRAEREILVSVLHISFSFKSPLYMAFPTADDPADRAVGPLSPLPCHAWHGYGVSIAHHGEVRGCRRACERTPFRGRRRCDAGGRCTSLASGSCRCLSFFSRRLSTWHQKLAPPTLRPTRLRIPLTSALSRALSLQPMIRSPLSSSKWRSLTPVYTRRRLTLPLLLLLLPTLMLLSAAVMRSAKPRATTSLCHPTTTSTTFYSRTSPSHPRSPLPD